MHQRIERTYSTWLILPESFVVSESSTSTGIGTMHFNDGAINCVVIDKLQCSEDQHGLRLEKTVTRRIPTTEYHEDNVSMHMKTGSERITTSRSALDKVNQIFNPSRNSSVASKIEAAYQGNSDTLNKSSQSLPTWIQDYLLMMA